MKLRFQIRLEQAVGEPEGEDVLRRLLAQEVVDPEDLALPEDTVHLIVQLDRAVQVGAERLLHHHPGPLYQARVLQHGDHRQRGLRRDGQVVQSQYVLAQFVLRLGDRRREGIRAGTLRHVAELAGEGRPLRLVQRPGAELGDRLVREMPERLGIHVLQGGRDDLHVGGQRGQRQVGQAGQQLASGQVAGSAEEDDHLRVEMLGFAPGGPGTERGIGDALRVGVCHGSDDPIAVAGTAGRSFRVGKNTPRPRSEAG